jgi:hypothetical protein
MRVVVLVALVALVVLAVAACRRPGSVAVPAEVELDWPDAGIVE